MNKVSLAASLVTYHNKISDLEKLLSSFTNESIVVRLYVWDNSTDDALRTFFAKYSFVDYHFGNENVGFGAGHNRNANRLTSEADYFLIVNPDVYFERGTLGNILEFASSNDQVSQLMPLVRYPDGQLQRLCKRLPTPFDLLLRRFIPFNVFSDRRAHYEMEDFSYDEIREIPFLSGCFSLIKLNAFKKVGGYDERFFMYMEDLDLCRRLKAEGATIFYPAATVYHKFEKESYRSFKLLRIHVVSALKYFNKYGWLEKHEV